MKKTSYNFKILILCFAAEYGSTNQNIIHISTTINLMPKSSKIIVYFTELLVKREPKSPSPTLSIQSGSDGYCPQVSSNISYLESNTKQAQ